mmetsp:Transcript_7532/g.7472  ORF Transcript_7532/g.7472 Transcript_7532/m.7472 type:complete len:276 (-) Transcript_7532:334-1161(-)
MKTTKDTNELITFIENDLQVNWRQDSKYLNKVIYHKATNATQDNLHELWTFVNSCDIDSFSVKYLFEGIIKNKQITNKGLTLISFYSNIDDSLFNNPDIYKFIILGVCENNENYSYDKIAFILRGLIYDATHYLRLPQETTKYETNKTVSENFKIIKRLVGFKLTKFEGKLAYYNRQVSPVHTLLTLLSMEEINHWIALKAHIKQNNNPTDLQEIVHRLQLRPCTVLIPQDQITKYEQYQNHKTSNARNRDRLYKLQQGIDNYTVQQMTERGIIV